MDQKTHDLWLFVVKAFMVIGVLSTLLGLYGHNAFVAYTGAGLMSLSLILAGVYGYLIPDYERHKKVQSAKTLKELQEITR